MKNINLGVLGLGTVGTGVYKMIDENHDVIYKRLGAALNIKKIADIDITTDRGIKIDKKILTTDANEVVQDPDIDIIIETIGGEDIAFDYIMKAINSGKHIVTANKALIASKGNTLFNIAIDRGVDIAFEASIGGCIPIIKTIRETLISNRINYMKGILNGTCNYILSKITQQGSSFEDALAEAQQKGYAEADPTLDIEGIDTAHKLAIFMSLAYGMELDFKNIYIEGITKITPMDIEMADKFGYRIKLLAITKNRGDSVEARVHPTMISQDNMLAKVDGSINAVTINGDKTSDIVLYGYGAGMMPTASAVLSDVIDVSRNILSESILRIPILSYQKQYIQKIPILPIEEIESQYYIRFTTLDRPGVLANISGILGKFNISIDSVHQKGRSSNNIVPIVMLTHEAKELHINKALNEIKSLDVVVDPPTLIRID